MEEKLNRLMKQHTRTVQTFKDMKAEMKILKKAYQNKTEMGNFTASKDYPQVTVKFLNRISTKERSLFVRDLMDKLFDRSELYGKTATGKKAPVCKGGKRKEAICQQKRDFIESMYNCLSFKIILLFFI